MAIRNVGVLAFASTALAAVHHRYQHNHLHARGAEAAPAIPTGLPACWGTCFQQAGVSSPEALANDAAVTECIKATCSAEDAAKYLAWLEKEQGAPYPTGSNSTAVAPVATGGYVSVPGAGYSTSVCTETSTLIYQSTTEYSTYVVTRTLSASAAPSEPAGGPGGYGDASSDVAVSPATEGAGGPGGYGPGSPSGTPGSPVGGDDGECSEVTVTTTERTTVTVTAGNGGGAPSSIVAPSSSVYEAPSSYEKPSPAATPSTYVSEAAFTSESSSSPSTYEAPAPAPSSYAQPSSSSPSSSEPSSPPTYDSGFRGKRGINYNDSSMVVPGFTESGKIGWASNWEGIPKGFENSAITYIPTLHDGSDYFTSMWAEQVESAIEQGLPFVFGPNEPDIASQSNLSPKACADVWRTHMEPYAGRIKLVAPSISSGIGPGLGLAWLEEFFQECSDCTFDAVNAHWYNTNGNDVEHFKEAVTGAAKHGLPVFLAEFGAIGTDEEISAFLEEILPWLDSNNDVIGYGYFMAYNGLLVEGDSLSPYGKTYCEA